MRIVEHRILHREAAAYCSHPHMAVGADGGWLVAFNRAPRRPLILHPPHDPAYRNLMMRSADEGRSWSAPRIVPSAAFHGVECPGLTATAAGRVLLNQWRFRWYPRPRGRPSEDADGMTEPRSLAREIMREWDEARRSASAGSLESLISWARGGGELWVHLSDDGGRSFARSRQVAVRPFRGGYGMRGAIELPDGELLLPLANAPDYDSVFLLRSHDGGESWSGPTLVAAESGKEFEEPAGLLLGERRILLMLRENRSRVLHRSVSDDGGRRWSRPVATGIRDYPAQLLHLDEGRIACVAGRRTAPFGILLYLSQDGGMSWDLDRPIVVRDDLANADLGYPTAARRRHGELVVVYYAQDREGVTGLHATTLTEDRTRST